MTLLDKLLAGGGGGQKTLALTLCGGSVSTGQDTSAPLVVGATSYQPSRYIPTGQTLASVYFRAIVNATSSLYPAQVDLFDTAAGAVVTGSTLSGSSDTTELAADLTTYFSAIAANAAARTLRVRLAMVGVVTTQMVTLLNARLELTVQPT